MRPRTLVVTVIHAARTLAQVSGSGNAIYQLSNDSEFSFVLEETLSLSNNFGANTGEVLRAASQIVPGDFESWYREFKFLANTIHNKAKRINATRFPVSAREAYFRSASYYRTADFFLHGNISDPRIYTLWDSALADFDAALTLLPTPGERRNVSASNFTVPVIFYEPQDTSSARPHNRLHNHARGDGKPREGSKKLPTIIAGNGYDGSQEDLYHQLGRSVLDRGWNFVTYEGPGQPTVRRQQNLGFIPNWWDVVTPVVDYLDTRDDVDMDRLALIGVSFGGTLAPRAASREHRLAAVLAIDGLVDIRKAIMEKFPLELNEVFQSGNQSLFDEIMLGLGANISAPTQLRWLVGQSLFAFDTASPFNWFTRLGEYVADASILNNVTAKVFVGAGEDDSLAPGQEEEMAGLLGNKSTFNEFKTNLGAGEHCQLGAEAQLAQVTMDWLADVFGGVQVPGNLTNRVLRVGE